MDARRARHPGRGTSSRTCRRDQADADRLAGGFPLLELGVERHGADPRSGGELERLGRGDEGARRHAVLPRQVDGDVGAQQAVVASSSMGGEVAVGDDLGRLWRTDVVVDGVQSSGRR
jgi:hypothetical protein